MANKPIFIFSRYCELCKYLLNSLKIPWENIFHMITYDNNIIKNRILKSKKVKINELPCIFVIDNGNKSIYKYEGLKAKEWIEKNLLRGINEKKEEVQKTIIDAPSISEIEQREETIFPPSRPQIEKGKGHEPGAMKHTSISLIDDTPIQGNIFESKEEYIPEEAREKQNSAASEKMDATKDKAYRMAAERDAQIPAGVR